MEKKGLIYHSENRKDRKKKEKIGEKIGRTSFCWEWRGQKIVDLTSNIIVEIFFFFEKLFV